MTYRRDRHKKEIRRRRQIEQFVNRTQKYASDFGVPMKDMATGLRRMIQRRPK